MTSWVRFALPARSSGCKLKKCWISLTACWIPEPQQQPQRVWSTQCCSGSSQTILGWLAVHIFYPSWSTAAGAWCCMWLWWHRERTSGLEAQEQLLPKGIAKGHCIAPLLLFRASSSNLWGSHHPFQSDSLLGYPKGIFMSFLFLEAGTW